MQAFKVYKTNRLLFTKIEAANSFKESHLWQVVQQFVDWWWCWGQWQKWFL